MKKTVFHTIFTVEGPILLTRQQLERLDDVIESIWRDFEDIHNRAFDELVEQRCIEHQATKSLPCDDFVRTIVKDSVARYFHRKEKHITLKFSDQSTAQFDGFQSLFLDTELLHRLPIKCVVQLRAADKECNFQIDQHSLTVTVLPERDEFTQKVFMKFKNWYESSRPSILFSLWGKHSQFIGWIGLCFFATHILFNSIDYGTRVDSLYAREARQIVQDGVSDDNYSKSIQLILAKTYDINPNDKPMVRPKWHPLLLWGGRIYCLLLLFRPKSTIAVGRGIYYVKCWNIYFKFIIISLPAYIALTYFLPFLIKSITSG
jgi:hypothetical protein